MNNGKPKMLPPIYGNIPEEMQGRRQWVNWKLEKSKSPNGKPYTKIPLNATTGKRASTTRHWTWASLATVKDRHQQYSAQDDRGEVQGVGYILQKGEVGIDLDNCRSSETGEIAEWATQIIKRLNSYTEISPSGSGIRIICHGQLPTGARRKGPVEMYDDTSPRYLTITGHHLSGTPKRVEKRQEEVAAVHAEHLGKVEPKSEAERTPPAANAAGGVGDLEIADILEVAFAARNGDKFRKLWRGDWQGDYASQSEADLALCSLLAFYSGPQPDVIDALFRQSGLMREKWEREDYREETIQNSLEKEDYYDWGRVDASGVDSIVGSATSHVGENAPLSQENSSVQASKAGPLDENAELYQASQAAKPQKKRSKIYTIAELAALPPPRWHIKGLFPQGGLVILWGQPGAGKSFVALDWGLSTATGIPWLGRDVQKGAVVYIAAEGVSGIAKRCLRWCEHHHLPGPATFGIIPEAFALIQNDQLKQLAQSIDEQMVEHPALIVIDTLNRNMGGSESSEDDMGSFIRAANGLQRAFNSTILIIHHTGWNVERERGHSSLRGAADTMISVTKMGERLTDGIEVACVKQKDADEFQNIAVSCVQVGHGDESSVVLAQEMDIGAMQGERRQREENGMLYKILRHIPDDHNQAIKVDDLIRASGLTEWKCRSLITRAINANYIIRMGEGTKGSPCMYYLTPPGSEVVKMRAALTLLAD